MTDINKIVTDITSDSLELARMMKQDYLFIIRGEHPDSHNLLDAMRVLDHEKATLVQKLRGEHNDKIGKLDNDKNTHKWVLGYALTFREKDALEFEKRAVWSSLTYGHSLEKYNIKEARVLKKQEKETRQRQQWESLFIEE